MKQEFSAKQAVGCYRMFALCAIVLIGACSSGGSRKSKQDVEETGSETTSDSVSGADDVTQTTDGVLTTGDVEGTSDVEEADTAVAVDFPGAPPAEDCLLEGACAEDTDCEAASRCNKTLEPPRCQKLYCGAEGSTCSDDANCATGLKCNGYYGSCEGGPGDCAEFSGQCRAGRPGEICGYNGVCGVGVECVPNPEAAEFELNRYICAEQGQLYTSCKTSADCDAPLGCFDIMEPIFEDGPTTVCREVARHGEACGAPNLPCELGLECWRLGSPQVCVDGRLGDRCAVATDDFGETYDFQCQGGLGCVLDQPLCKPELMGYCAGRCSEK